MAKPFLVCGVLAEDAAEFKVAGGYEFPFVGMDPTPGGSNLGRIEWHIELIRGRRRAGRIAVEQIALWASQTRGPRYRGKYFLLECNTPGIMRRSRHDGYLAHVWQMGFCGDHGNITFSAYPENYHTKLHVDNLFISVGSDVCFA